MDWYVNSSDHKIKYSQVYRETYTNKFLRKSNVWMFSLQNRQIILYFIVGGSTDIAKTELSLSRCKDIYNQIYK